MWQTPKVLRTSAQFLHPPPLTPTSPSTLPPGQQYHCQFSRRELSILSSSSLVLLGPQTLDPNPLILHHHHLPSKAQAAEENPTNTNQNINGGLQEEDNINIPKSIPSGECVVDKTPTKKAFLDISIDGQPAGRIVIGLYGNSVPAGASRFSNLVSGAAGISYRRKEFVKIMPNYVQHGGMRSYGVDAELAKETGSGLAAVDRLREEWERVNNGNCSPAAAGTRHLQGSVGIIVRDPLKPPPKLKLVARNGKLEIDQEEVGLDPNGTEFVIATKDSPELDAAALVVGRVLEGMEVVQRIAQVKTVQENTASPYFRVAKLIGDKRAIVAQRGFNRPYSKVLVSNCGLLE